MRTITIDSSDRTAIARLGEWTLGTTAYRGEVGTGSLIIDDPSTAIDIEPLKAVTVVESASTPSRIHTGYTAERGIQRGPLKAGTQRQWMVTLEDLNVLLDDILIGPTGTRPEETDRARIIWLISEPALTYYGITKGQVPNTATKKMSKTNYQGGKARDVLEDCSQRTGKNFYVYDEGSGFKLYYDKQANASTSPISISDVSTDVNGTTVFAPSALDILKDPERKYDRIRLQYKGGVIERGSVPGSGRIREKRVVNKRIKNAKRARDHVKNLLAQTDAETVVIGVTLAVPASVVGDIRAGQKINIKLAHAGISSYTKYRIKNVQIGPRSGNKGHSDVEYTVKLTMADKIRPTHVQDVGGNSGGGGTPPGEKDDTGDVVDAQDHLFDGFDRGPFPSVEDTADTDSTGTTHVIALPDGSDLAGRLLLLFVNSTEDDATIFTQLGVLGIDVTGPGYQGDGSGRVVWRFIDGLEGWDKTGATLTVTTPGSETVIVHAVLHSLTHGSVFDAIERQADSSADPPLVTPGTTNPLWVTINSARWYTWGWYKTAAITGDPTGYANVYDNLSGGRALRVNAKNDDSAAEDPSAYTMTGGSLPKAGTIAIRAHHLGRTPLQDVTFAWWEGNNLWFQSAVSTTDITYGVDGSVFWATSAAHTKLIAHQLNPVAADAPLMPWEGSSWTMEGRFQVDVAGKVGDDGVRLFQLKWVFSGQEAIFNLRFGDGTRAEGLLVLGAATSYAAKAITEGEWMRFKWQMDNGTTRARMWLESTAEPLTWDVETTGLTAVTDPDLMTMTVWIGNDGAPSQTFQLDYLRFLALGQSGDTVNHPQLAVGDGTATIFTLQPFRQGTLHVTVDGISVLPVSVDPDAGTMTFDRAPAFGAVISVVYEAL